MMLMMLVKITFTVVATIAFIVIGWYLEEGEWPPARLWWRRLRDRARLWWRRLRGRCVHCGYERRRHVHCYHCAASTYYEWHACHGCAKSLNFARAYGAGNTVLERVVRERDA